MRVVVVGLGIQGRKRLAVAGPAAVATVDPVAAGATYQAIEQVPLDAYDAALVCTPDQAKLPILEYLLTHRKHLLVEKPVIAPTNAPLARLKELAERNGTVCYTAYNHRFEPHILRLKQALDSGELGEVYLAKFFYGNGTARDVRNSVWRDQDLGVFPDLGSHLLDWTLMLFGRPGAPPVVTAAHRFENRAYDHFRFGFAGRPALDFEMTLLSWRNTFRCDVFAEKGSVHIDCLCKWGPSLYTRRTRVLPSGRPAEQVERLECPDPTWVAEYGHFLRLCAAPAHNLDNDMWINEVFNRVRRDLGLPAPAA
ncbi:MAG TPA: Gfo/Idh/MocA family oxidoreductase [Lacunisphaera sp.]|nr:Gfo/Idh/MocA family oxidoreductase [Lacunisphaera sp.]